MGSPLSGGATRAPLSSLPPPVPLSGPLVGGAGLNTPLQELSSQTLPLGKVSPAGSHALSHSSSRGSGRARAELAVPPPPTSPAPATREASGTRQCKRFSP